MYKKNLSNEHLSLCFFKEEERIAFLNIPKNGSSTIRKTLGFKTRIEYSKVLDFEKKFIILRDPMERIISSYFEVIKARPDGPKDITVNKDFYIEKSDLIKSFNLFIDDLLNNGFYEEHTFPQFYFIESKGIKIEDIGKSIDLITLENIKKDFLNVSKKYGFNFKKLSTVLHTISPKKEKKELKKYLNSNKKLRNNIKKIYECDVKLMEELNLYNHLFNENNLHEQKYLIHKEERFK